MAEIETPAPAPSETPAPTISAGMDAASKGDFSAFDAAEVSAKRGTPLPRVEAPVIEKPVAGAVPVERTVSKRQEAINDRTRTAVEQATADLQAENARLKAQLATPPAPRVEPVPVEPPVVAKTPEYKRYMAMPDAPKLADFESVEEHAFAATLFINRTVYAEQQADARSRQHDETRAKFLNDRGQEYGDRLRQAAEADPAVRTKIDPAIMAARPISGLAAGDVPTFANAIAETGLFSPNPAALYVYLTEHREDAERIAALPTQEHCLRALAQLDGQLNPRPSAVAAPTEPSPAARAAVPSTITAAPSPVHTVTKAGSSADPKAAALARGDFDTFNKLELAKETARRGHA